MPTFGIEMGSCAVLRLQGLRRALRVCFFCAFLFESTITGKSAVHLSSLIVLLGLGDVRLSNILSVPILNLCSSQVAHFRWMTHSFLMQRGFLLLGK